MSAIVALTAQNTVGVTAVHELPPDFVVAQLEAVFDDIGVDAAKTGMLFSRALIEAVAGLPRRRIPVPLVVDPVMVASSGARLLEDDAVDALVARLFPLATVVTPNLPEASALAGRDGTRRELAERLVELGAPAASSPAATATRRRPSLRRPRHVEIPVERHDVAATHGAGLHALGDARGPARARAAARRGRARRGAPPRDAVRARPRRDRRRRRPRRRPQPERRDDMTGRRRCARCASASRSSTRSRTTSS